MHTCRVAGFGLAMPEEGVYGRVWRARCRARREVAGGVGRARRAPRAEDDRSLTVFGARASRSRARRRPSRRRWRGSSRRRPRWRRLRQRRRRRRLGRRRAALPRRRPAGERANFTRRMPQWTNTRLDSWGRRGALRRRPGRDGGAGRLTGAATSSSSPSTTAASTSWGAGRPGADGPHAGGDLRGRQGVAEPGREARGRPRRGPRCARVFGDERGADGGHARSSRRRPGDVAGKPWHCDPRSPDAAGLNPLKAVKNGGARPRVLLRHGAWLRDTTSPGPRTSIGSPWRRASATSSGLYEARAVVELLASDGKGDVLDMDLGAGMGPLRTPSEAAQRRRAWAYQEAGRDLPPLQRRATDGSGRTALMEAAILGDVTAIVLPPHDPRPGLADDLVRRGEAGVAQRAGPRQLQRLMHAARRLRQGCVRALRAPESERLRRGRRREPRDKATERTALHLAAMCEVEQPKTIRALCPRQGRRPRKGRAWSLTPLHPRATEERLHHPRAPRPQRGRRGPRREQEHAPHVAARAGAVAIMVLLQSGAHVGPGEPLGRPRSTSPSCSTTPRTSTSTSRPWSSSSRRPTTTRRGPRVLSGGPAPWARSRREFARRREPPEQPLPQGPQAAAAEPPRQRPRRGREEQLRGVVEQLLSSSADYGMKNHTTFPRSAYLQEHYFKIKQRHLEQTLAERHAVVFRSPRPSPRASCASAASARRTRGHAKAQVADVETPHAAAAGAATARRASCPHGGGSDLHGGPSTTTSSGTSASRRPSARSG